jgi:glycosyltransferase involved in cell wall biosynthesis
VNDIRHLNGEEPNDSPSVSVIIPVLGDDPAIERCADGLRGQTLAQSRFEVIVVENGPVEGSAVRLQSLASMMSGLPVRVLNEPKSGSYAARNCGIKAALADILVFTDADCVPDPHWLALGLEHLARDPKAGALAGSIHLFAASEGSRTGAELYELLHGFPQERYVRALHFGATANLFVRRSAFARAGAFNERLTSGGDVEWGRRIHALGIVMAYDADVRVRHPARADWPALSKKLRRVASGVADLRMQTDTMEEARPFRVALRPLVPPLLTIYRAGRSPQIRNTAEFIRYTQTLLRVRLTVARIRLEKEIARTARRTGKARKS